MAQWKSRGANKAAERGIVLRAIDKLDRLGIEGVRQLLGDGRKDESGDFTKGAGLSAEQAEVVIAFMEARRDLAATVTAFVRSSQVLLSVRLV